MSQNGPCLWTGLPQSSPAPCERFKLACCSHQHYVYVLGGRHSTCQRDFWRYNVCNEWTELNCTSEAAPEALEEHSMVAHEAESPSNRKAHSAVVIESAMLVYGGYIDLKGSSQEFWSLDLLIRPRAPAQ
uniref:Uncharacterized protein n=1 Tax=Periophthalmus magnuspinnatus TaxID=409849 RepID=A0A3B4AE13_9GOBI